MPFPINPSVGDTYVENDTTYEYLGPVNGWFRKEVGPNNDTTYIGRDGAPGGVSNDTEVIFNDNGSLASDSGLTYNKTTDALSGGAFVPTGSTVPSNGIYLPSANNVAISTNDTPRMTITSGGNIEITGRIYRSDAGSCGILFSTSSAIVPQDNTGNNADNAVALGNGIIRFSVVYAATGTINTSDASLKQDISDLDASELSVATAIKGLIKKFRFVDAVINKGDDARVHVGVIAQEVEQAFVDAGLDPRRYGMFCEDELEDGTKRLGIRYDELLAFVIAAL